MLLRTKERLRKEEGETEEQALAELAAGSLSLADNAEGDDIVV
jgi:hypothetical protein